MGWYEQLAGERWASVVAALLHTLWQGGIVLVLLFLYLRRVSADRPGSRYAASLTALIAIVVCGLVTWGILDRGPSTASHASAQSPASEIRVSRTVSSTAVIGKTDAVRPNQPPASTPASDRTDWASRVAAVWLLGATVMCLRAAVMVLGAGRFRRRCRAVTDRSVEMMIQQLSERLGITRRVRIAMCEHLRAPAALGLIWPTILLPVSAVTGLDRDYLRAILAHELAHVRRYDYLVNVVQLLIEALLFFNPVVWWISRQIRIEREACCDALAVSITGDQVVYASALAAWAERLIAPARDLAAAPAFGDTVRAPGLADRVKRVVLFNHRPALRMSWYGLAGVVVAGAILAGCFKQAGTVGASTASKWLSQEQRVAKLAEVEKAYGAPGGRAYGKADKIRVSGTIRTHDGSPLPDDLKIGLGSERRGSAWGAEAKLAGSHFDGTVEYGRVSICAASKKYAPVLVGPFDAQPGGTIEGVELVLQPGFTGHLRLVNSRGEPIRGASVEGRYEFPFGGARPTFTADSTGLATAERCSDRPMSLRIWAPGYQYSWHKLAFKPGETPTCVLEPARPTSGVIISRDTGRPVKDAELRLLIAGGEGPEDSPDTACPETASLAAKSDEHGRFSLTSLRDGTVYAFYVEHPDYRRELLTSVTAGQTLAEVKLGPPLYVRGRIIGLPDELVRQGKDLSISYCNPYHIGFSNSWFYQQATAKIRDGAAHFEISRLWSGEVDIVACDKRNLLFVDEQPLDNVVIDLHAKADEKKRAVELHLQTPKGCPQPTGQFCFSYTMAGGPEPWPGDQHRAEIREGLVKFEVPVPARVKYGGNQWRGYVIGDGFENHQDIPDGNGPLVIKVPVKPAGVIHGKVLGPDNEPLRGRSPDPFRGSGTSVEIIAVRGRWELRQFDSDFRWFGQLDEDKGTFLSGPLALGHKYLVIVHRDQSFVMSDEIRLDAAVPTHQVELKVVEGVTVEGQVLTPEGAPATGIGVRISCCPRSGHDSFGASEVHTDREGRFRLPHVNPGISGTYSISVQAPGHRPIDQDLKIDGKPLVFRLKKGLTVRGVIVDNDSGYPVEGARIYARGVGIGSDTVYAEESSNGRGEFEITGMAAGKYWLGVHDAKLAAEQAWTMVTAGEDKPVKLRIRPLDHADMKVRKPSTP